jgi:hypothetical protein
VADGIGLIGLSVLLYLNTSGYLPWSFWLDAVGLWPLLVASLGVTIAFEKSRAPWLVLLGPVLVLGGLFWLASGGRPSLPDGPWQAESAVRPEGVERLELEVKLAAARLRLAAADDVARDRLVDGRSLRGEAGQLETTRDGAVGRVRLTGGRRGGIVFLPRPRDYWDLRLAKDLPVDVRLKGAGLGARLDLAGTRCDALRAEGVFLGVDARLGAPERDTEIVLGGVFNSLSLAVPPGTPVRVRAQGPPFNATSAGLPGEPGRPGYDVRLKGIFSAVHTSVDPSLAPGPAAPERTPNPAAAPVAESR